MRPAKSKRFSDEPGYTLVSKAGENVLTTTDLFEALAATREYKQSKLYRNDGTLLAFGAGSPSRKKKDEAL